MVKRLLVREIQNRLGNQRGGAEDIAKHPWFAGTDFNAFYSKKIKAPWIPKIKGLGDTSHFDPYGIEDHPNTGPTDSGDWDKDF